MVGSPRLSGKNVRTDMSVCLSARTSGLGLDGLPIGWSAGRRRSGLASSTRNFQRTRRLLLWEWHSLQCLTK